MHQRQHALHGGPELLDFGARAAGRDGSREALGRPCRHTRPSLKCFLVRGPPHCLLGHGTRPRRHGARSRKARWLLRRQRGRGRGPRRGRGRERLADAPNHQSSPADVRTVEATAKGSPPASHQAPRSPVAMTASSGYEAPARTEPREGMASGAARNAVPETDVVVHILALDIELAKPIVHRMHDTR